MSSSSPLCHLSALEEEAVLARNAYRRELLREDDTRFRLNTNGPAIPVIFIADTDWPGKFGSYKIDRINWDSFNFTRVCTNVLYSPHTMAVTGYACHAIGSKDHPIPRGYIIDVLKFSIMCPDRASGASQNLTEIKGLLGILQAELQRLCERATEKETALYRDYMQRLQLTDYVCKDVASVVESYLAEPLSDGLVPKPVYGVYDNKKKRKREQEEEEKAN